MQAGEFLAAAKALPFADLEEICGGGGLVVVAPHPDDESLGCGGLIAAACAHGVPVRVVVVSDGTGSHAGSRRYPHQRLRDLREAELREAVAALGLGAEAVRFLRLPDRSVPTGGPLAEAAQDAIVGAARECAAGALCVTWDRDPHCDHAASAALVLAVRERLGTARIFFYPVWGWTLPRDTEVGPRPSGVRLDISDHLTAKASAIAAHRSQTSDLIDDDPNGFRLADGMLAHFTRSYEILLYSESPR